MSNKLSRGLSTIASTILAKDGNGATGRRLPNHNDLNLISSDIIKNISNNNSIENILTDMEKAKQLLTSSILSPNDMINSKLIYKIDDVSLPAKTIVNLRNTIAAGINERYHLDSKLTTILDESITTIGSYIMCVIPDNTIKAMVKSAVSLEELKSDDSIIDGYKIFNESENETISLESLDLSFSDKDKDISKVDVSNIAGDVEITDNLNYLKHGNVSLEDKVEKVENVVDKLLSSKDNIGDMEKDISNLVDNLLDRSINKNKAGYIGINPDDSERNTTRPLCLKLPSASVIPVHAIGAPEEHLGYFVLINENGVPVTSNSSINDIKLDRRTAINDKSQYEKIRNAEKSMLGITKAPTLGNMEDLYSSIVESKIKSSLKNSIYSGTVDISEVNDIYRTMFARSLKNLETRLLFLPSNLVTYVAFRYKDNGTGESLMETVTTLSSMRAMLLMSKVKKDIDSSIVGTKLSATLDEKDDDPEKTRDIIISEFMKNNNKNRVPWNTVNVGEIDDYFHKASVSVDIRHPTFSNIEMDIEKTNKESHNINTDLDDKLKNMTMLKFGIPPELIDNAKDVEFATTIIANNLMLTKTIKQYQTTFSDIMTKHVRTLVKYDGILSNIIEDILNKNKNSMKSSLKSECSTDEEKKKIDELFKSDDNVDILVSRFKEMIIKNLRIELPEPENQEAVNLSEAYNAYKDNVEDVLDYLVSSDAIKSSFDGDNTEEAIEEFRDILKSILLKKWMSDNDYLTEVFNYIDTDAGGRESNDLFNDHAKFITGLIDIYHKYKKINNKDFKNADNKAGKLINNDVEEEPSEPEAKPNTDDGTGEGDNLSNDSTGEEPLVE